LNGKTYVSIASLRRLESGKAGLWVPNFLVVVSFDFFLAYKLLRECVVDELINR
jgi:hypothetical protein